MEGGGGSTRPGRAGISNASAQLMVTGPPTGTSGVWTGAQEQIPLQVQLPVQLQLPAQVPGRKSNSTGSARPRALYLGDGDPPLRRPLLHGLSAESKSALLAA